MSLFGKLCAPVRQRGGFPSFRQIKGHVFPDTRSSVVKEAIEVAVGRDSLSVQGPVFWTVDCPSGLHQGVCSRVCLGALPRDSSSSVSGRLAGSRLFGGGGQKEHPGSALGLSLPQDHDKREVSSRTLADCKVPSIPGPPGFFYPMRGSRNFCWWRRRFVLCPPPPCSALAGGLGTPGFVERLVPHSRLRMRSLQWHLKTHWSPESDPPSLPVPLSREVREDLSWWMVRDHLLMGVRFGTPTLDIHLYSDESRSGWGAHLLDRVVFGVWSEQKLLHINLLEMKALFLALQSFQELVAGRRLTAMCDNLMVVAYVNKQGGTVYRSLCSLASRLLRWTESLDVHLDTRYLPGQSNVLADLLSRRDQVIGTEWSLHPQVARDLLRRWGSPSIDLFATSLNA